MQPLPGATAESRLSGRPPFAIRARLLTPLAEGGTRFEPDAVLRVDDRGCISEIAGATDDVIDLRPMLLLPGMIDLHAHLPQLPNAGLGGGLDLLTWLEVYIFPLERTFDRTAAERLAPLAFRAFAAAGTTTVVLYGAVFEPSTDAAFSAAEAHGIRAVIGKVMMDRFRYDARLPDGEVLETSLRQSADLIERWHGRDDGRLRYAVTPRFAVSCTADMLRESAALASATGTYWQTHLAEDHREIGEVRRLFPDAIDYTDVYDRAGGLGANAILAHAVHLSDREVRRGSPKPARASRTARRRTSSCRAARCRSAATSRPGSPSARDPTSPEDRICRSSAPCAPAPIRRTARRAMLGDQQPPLTPLDWLRMGTLDGARVLGQDDRIGSLEVGKDADFIAGRPVADAAE